MHEFPAFAAEHLATAVVMLDGEGRIAYLNPAAELLFDVSGKSMSGHPWQQIVMDTGQLSNAMQQALRDNASYTEHDLMLGTHMHGKLHLRCTVTPVPHGGGRDMDDAAVAGRQADEHGGYARDETWRVVRQKTAAEEAPCDQYYNGHLLLEFHAMDMTLKLAREEQMLDQTHANRMLLRNLAHEIGNPLGGIRGAAQLLEQELEKTELREYTQIIVQESDRLRSLLERLLSPQKNPYRSALNIHEVLERVRSVILAEMPIGLVIRRDYDISLPLLVGDGEQLIQAMLNMVRNAAQALQGSGIITLRTRIARQVTLLKQRHRLAVMVQVIDNGPGIPAELQDKIFYPLVSGRVDGHGLGLTMAQDLVNQHHGAIEFYSEPGYTCFTVSLPLP